MTINVLYDKTPAKRKKFVDKYVAQRNRLIQQKVNEAGFQTSVGLFTNTLQKPITDKIDETSGKIGKAFKDILDNADKFVGPAGPAGAPGAPGPAGAAGPSGYVPPLFPDKSRRRLSEPDYFYSPTPTTTPVPRPIAPPATGPQSTPIKAPAPETPPSQKEPSPPPTTSGKNNVSEYIDGRTDHGEDFLQNFGTFENEEDITGEMGVFMSKETINRDNKLGFAVRDSKYGASLYLGQKSKAKDAIDFGALIRFRFYKANDSEILLKTYMTDPKTGIEASRDEILTPGLYYLYRYTVNTLLRESVIQQDIKSYHFTLTSVGFPEAAQNPKTGKFRRGWSETIKCQKYQYYSKIIQKSNPKSPIKNDVEDSGIESGGEEEAGPSTGGMLVPRHTVSDKDSWGYIAPRPKIRKGKFKIDTEGKMGEITINLPMLLSKFKLVAKRGDTVVAKEKLTKKEAEDLHYLLTNRFNKKRNYAAKALSTFELLRKESGLPLINSTKSKKASVSGTSFEYYNTPDLFQKMNILAKEIYAGNNSSQIKNHISAMLDVLLERGEINSEQMHSALNQLLGKGA